VDARWGWLTEETDENLAPLTPEDFLRLREHIEALCFWEDAGMTISSKHWHFQPREFIGHMRMCGWLSEGEFAQIFPDSVYSTTALSKIDTSPSEIREKYRIILNRLSEKYSINSPARRSHFYGQGAVESSNLSLMVEGSVSFTRTPTHASFKTEENGYYKPTNQHDYLMYLEGVLGNIELGDGPKFRGRGMKQLTGRENYSKYWVYRGWLDRKSFKTPWWNPSKPNDAPQIGNPEKLSTNPYSSIDAGGWYWSAGSATNQFRSINSIIISDTIDHDTIFAVAKSINGINRKTGEPNGLNERIIATNKISKILMDAI
jgi:hydroxyethylthiazole kinase